MLRSFGKTQINFYGIFISILSGLGFFVGKNEGIKAQKNIKEVEKVKDKIFGVMQRVGRSFMLPIAILPVAGLFLGIGGSFTNPTTLETYGLTNIMGEGTILNNVLTVMNDAGDIVFANLPLIFAIGCAIGMARSEKGYCSFSGRNCVFDYAFFYWCYDSNPRRR
ncbi:PTS transporter subunit EIIC [Jeotgalibaca sp. MA1X17-3]|uniref:PTS transporter subunit EIIC n=1 Tax=Jeotgalibaca sp. MA1X17-3 TaxID=2908211 RepID=UPI001F1ECA3C|nr:PTS transporter subunit EIIC [Jeotgalibaca sp. MA1X17-3]UJF16339.1 PTS transporter subunit EIIC [Jeotgalibaca sp. MA1X17-3]